jgi:hypothetical protein
MLLLPPPARTWSISSFLKLFTSPEASPVIAALSGWFCVMELFPFFIALQV